MKDSLDTRLSWQAVALELLRRLTGAPPGLSTEQLQLAGTHHQEALVRKGLETLYFATCAPGHVRQRLYDILWEVQLRETRAVVEAIERDHARVVVLKGIEVGARYQAAHGLYVSVDVDLLVSGTGVWAAERALFARQYAYLKQNDEAGAWTEISPVEAFRFAAAGYELLPLVKELEIEGVDAECLALARSFPKTFRVSGDVLYVAVKFDVHHNVLFNFDMKPMWQRIIPSALGAGHAFCLADQLWFLIHRYYFEVATGSLTSPRVLAPIAALLGEPALDWSLVVRNAVELNATAPLLYWLSFFHRLGAPHVPEAVLAELQRHHGGSERNWGWQIGRLFDVIEAFPANVLAP